MSAGAEGAGFDATPLGRETPPQATAAEAEVVIAATALPAVAERRKNLESVDVVPRADAVLIGPAAVPIATTPGLPSLSLAVTIASACGAAAVAAADPLPAVRGTGALESAPTVTAAGRAGTSSAAL